MDKAEQQDGPIGFVAIMDWALRIVATVAGVGALTIFVLSLERVAS